MKVRKIYLVLLSLSIVIFFYSKVIWISLEFDINNQSLIENFSPVHFTAPGNNFVGGIFWLPTKSLSGNIKITLDGQEKKCNKQVRGIYFNSQRGKRIWPLDEYTLELLQQTNTWYNQLEIEWWLYTSCTGDDYSIFGQINYDRSNGTTGAIIAWTNLDYQENDYGNNGNYTFANNLQYFDNKTPMGYIWDSYWWIGFIGGNLTGHEDLITYLNNGQTINDAFEQTDTGVTSTTGSRQFLSNISWNNASNIIRNLLVQWSVWLSQSMAIQDRTSLLGNPWEKTIIIGTENISNATLINQAKQNMEKLCKGKTRLNLSALPPPSNSNVLCFYNTQELEIDLLWDQTKYQNKTIIVKSGNIILSGSMENSFSGVDIFIDQWNLYIRNNPANLQSFDNQGYITMTGPINSGVLLRGTIIVNWLLIGWSRGNETWYNHKLYVQGKISSLNTPFAPTQARMDFVEDVLGTDIYSSRIWLQNVFIRTCLLGWIGTDGSFCADASRISSIPLVIVDGKYSSRLLDN